MATASRAVAGFTGLVARRGIVSKGRSKGRGHPNHRSSDVQHESFWQEVQEVQQKHVQAAREAQARRKKRWAAVAKEESKAEAAQEEELTEVSLAEEGVPIQEMEMPRSLRGISAPGIPADSIVLAERLLSAKSPAEVLVLGQRAVETLEDIQADSEQGSRRLGQVALALQLLARQATGPRKITILKDRRLSRMVDALHSNVQHLEVWTLAAGACALGKLGTLSLQAAQQTATAAEALLRRSEEKLPEFQTSQAALVLASLAMVPERLGAKANSQLRNSLVAMLELQSQDLSPEACAHLAPALVKLRDQSDTLAQGVAKRLASNLETLAPEEVATAAQSLVALRHAPTKLMEATQKVLRHQVHLCTPRAVVHFAGALSEGRGDVDAFHDFLMPAARSFISDFNCRDLCTLAESFAKASCSEADFLADLADSLQRKVSEMGAHEVSVAFQVFSPVSYAVPKLLPSVAEKAFDLANELSPKQLTHTLQGLSRSQLAAPELLSALKGRAQQLSHVLFGTHAVTALVSLADSEQLDEKILQTLLDTILRHLDRLSSQDYIAVLSTISRLPASFRSALPVSCVEEIMQALRSRGYGPWRLEVEAVVHLLEALHGLRQEDEVLLELVLDRLPAALQLSDLSLTLLLRLMESLAELPKRSRAQVAAHLHRRRKLQNVLKDSIYKQVTSKNLDLEAQVMIAKAIVRLGYEEALTQELLERLTFSPELPRLSLDTCCDLCFTLAAQTWQIEWTRRFAWKVLHRLYGVEIPQALQDGEPPTQPRTAVDGGSLLRLAWALAVINEALPMQLLEDLVNLPLPKDWGGYGLRQLQEVALHHQIQVRLNNESAPCKVKDWMELVLQVPREDQYVPQQPRRAERNRKQIAAARYSYETWLTVTLSQLHLPHQAQQVVGCHRVPITFKQQMHLIDVLSLEDLTSPAVRITGGAELRRRQLMQLGWAMHSVRLPELYEAARTGTLRLVVSKLVSSMDQTAASGGFAEPMVRKNVPKVRPLSPVARVQKEVSDGWLRDEEEFDSLQLGSDPSLVLRQRARKATHLVEGIKKGAQG